MMLKVSSVKSYYCETIFQEQVQLAIFLRKAMPPDRKNVFTDINTLKEEAMLILSKRKQLVYVIKASFESGFLVLFILQGALSRLRQFLAI